MIHNLLLEIRPRLQSVNGYLLTNIETATLKFDKNKLLVIENDKIVDQLAFDLPIKANSLQSLILDDSLLSFRFLIDANNFQSDLLEMTKNLNEIALQADASRIKIDMDYDLTCIRCQNAVFAKKFHFKRVLPLPSDNIEAADWFCHKSTKNFSLVPKSDDLFYAQSFFHINADCDVKVDGKAVKCEKCYAWLGLLVDEGKTLKLWTNTVSLNSKMGKIESLPLQDVYKCLKSLLKDATLLFKPTLKIVLNCPISDTMNDYLLIWVLEKELEVHSFSNAMWSKNIVAKVLFQYSKKRNVLVDEWCKEISTQSFTVSKIMIEESLKHLMENNALIPMQFNKSNGFFVSYLRLYDN